MINVHARVDWREGVRAIVSENSTLGSSVRRPVVSDCADDAALEYPSSEANQSIRATAGSRTPPSISNLKFEISDQPASYTSAPAIHCHFRCYYLLLATIARQGITSDHPA